MKWQTISLNCFQPSLPSQQHDLIAGTSKACLDTRAILSTIAQAVKEQTSKSHLKQKNGG